MGMFPKAKNIIPETMLCNVVQINHMEKRRGEQRKECDKVVALGIKQCNHDSAMVNERVKRNNNINNLYMYIFPSFLYGSK